MATFAVIENGKVSNVIVAETKAVAESVTGLKCVEYVEEDRVAIGYGYDEEAEKFIYPVSENPNEA